MKTTMGMSSYEIEQDAILLLIWYVSNCSKFLPMNTFR